MPSITAKFSQLPSAGALLGAEIVPIVQDGTSKQTTAAALRESIEIAGLVDKGTVGTGTVTFNRTSGAKQKLTVSGPLTVAFAGWPASGVYSELEIQLVNGGVNVTWPTVSWMRGDGTSNTTFSSMGVTLASSGTNWVFVWTTNGGTTLYGKAI